MIFQHTYPLVLSGTKTQTRRPKRPFEELSNHDYGTRCVRVVMRHHQAQYLENPRIGRYGIWHTKWRVGGIYAVQPGRGKPGVGRIQLNHIGEVERAGDLTEADALAEGFASVEEFREVYAKMHGEQALEEPCWVLHFERVS